jgi:hypothetical protein
MELTKHYIEITGMMPGGITNIGLEPLNEVAGGR